MPEPLLPRVAAGEESAVRECLDRYGGLVWTLARRLLGTTPEAEDAVQEVFIDLWRSAGRFNPSLGSEPTFVTLLARRRIIDRRRRTRRSPDALPVLEALPAAPSRDLERVDLQDEAARAVKALLLLREDQRRVLELAVFHGLTHEEIARDTGLPLGTVKTHVRRGLLRVRALLEVPSPPLSPARPGRGA